MHKFLKSFILTIWKITYTWHNKKANLCECVLTSVKDYRSFDLVLHAPVQQLSI